MAKENNGPTKKRLVIVLCLFIGIFIAYLDRVNVSILAANDPFLISMGIAGEPIQIGMMMTAFLMAYGISNILFSPLGDLLGPRKSMMLCILIWTIALLIGGWAISFAMIIIARILLGIGEGFYYPLQSVFVKNWFPQQERGRANAFWTIGQSIAPAIAMPFFALLVAVYGWRSTFYFCAAIGIIPFYLLWRYTADTPRQLKGISQKEVDYIEAGQETEPDNTLHKITLWQRVNPFILNYHYWLLVLWYLCLQSMYWGLITWLPAYLKVERGFLWAEMGWLASLPFILSIFSKAITGVLSDKIGRNAPILFAAMSLAAFCVYFGALAENKYLSAILLSFAVAFSTMGTPIVWTLLQRIVVQRSMSIAGGVMSGIASGLSSLSPAFIGLFILLTGSYSGGLLSLVVTGIIATVAALILMIKGH